MGRKGRNRRNRKQGARGHTLLYHFNAHTIEQYIENDFAYEELKRKQTEYRERIAALEQDMLNRTILVTNVLSLNEKSNLDRLKAFLEQSFGPIQCCIVSSFGTKGKIKKGSIRERYPPARVTFEYQTSAENIFGGKLTDVAGMRKAVQFPCHTVGYKRFIKVSPSQNIDGMVQDNINGSKLLTLTTEGLCIGHWFPVDYDIIVALPGFESEQSCLANEWFEEQEMEIHPILKIDLVNALILLDFTNCKKGDRGNHGEEIFSGLSHIMAARGLDEGDIQEEIVSFRFKDLVHAIELCERQEE
jgi:hypothetical protein